ncbi:deoxyribodipyrimidine photolyase [Opitutia bacterium ISCC 51]|nr:deoxyribodipyrimidine photolyase [Opitutae bacterium ISCC 51]QXD28661.1 deoxyribodipyrimidine photolyase [Opitutae bacterium ISCC 52]
MIFPTQYNEVLNRIEQVDPIAYGRSRNFVDGAVTYLSPYISRGVISTKQVLHSVLGRGYNPEKIKKFIQELAWRDYWQQVWIHKGSAIEKDLLHPQPGFDNHQLAISIIRAETGIHAIDTAIETFYETGYLHNHVRMYVAAMACNLGRSHWRAPARWMYHHLLDGDWASNALSWQWVAGSNSRKQYIANQENINRYCHSQQRGTFLDKPYSRLLTDPKPEALVPLADPELTTKLPKTTPSEIDAELPTLIYNYYNLDPRWHVEMKANRVLLLEPEVFSKYPVSEPCIRFVLELAKNIPGIQIFTGSFAALQSHLGGTEVRFKEHPLNQFQGTEEPREWMFETTGYFRSFFAFWKRCERETR